MAELQTKIVQESLFQTQNVQYKVRQLEDLRNIKMNLLRPQYVSQDIEETFMNLLKTNEIDATQKGV